MSKVTVTLKGWIVGYHWHFQKAGEVSWGFSPYYDPKEADTNVVMAFPHSFDVQVPDQVNVVAGLVASLEAAKIKALADYQRSVADINARLSKLLAIEHIPAGEVADSSFGEFEEAQA